MVVLVTWREDDRAIIRFKHLLHCIGVGVPALGTKHVKLIDVYKLLHSSIVVIVVVPIFHLKLNLLLVRQLYRSKQNLLYQISNRLQIVRLLLVGVILSFGRANLGRDGVL